MQTNFRSLPEEVCVLILTKTNDLAVHGYRGVSHKCKNEAEMARALAQEGNAQFFSVHAVEQLPLLKPVERFFGGCVSLNLYLTNMKGEDRADYFK